MSEYSGDTVTCLVVEWRSKARGSVRYSVHLGDTDALREYVQGRLRRDINNDVDPDEALRPMAARTAGRSRLQTSFEVRRVELPAEHPLVQPIASGGHVTVGPQNPQLRTLDGFGARIEAVELNPSARSASL